MVATSKRFSRICCRSSLLATSSRWNWPWGSMTTWRNWSAWNPISRSTASFTFCQPSSMTVPSSSTVLCDPSPLDARTPVRFQSVASGGWVMNPSPRFFGRSCSGRRRTR
jgi:hypothetical protein